MNREEVLQRYRSLKARWDEDDDLRQEMPETYKGICKKLTALENGAKFKVIDRKS